MSSTNKKSPATRGIPQPFDRPGGRPSGLKPVLAQQKTRESAQGNKRPTAPPAFRPETATRPVQLKVANSTVNHKPPVAPPVYRPQPVPKVLQTKRSLTQNLEASKAFAGRPVSHSATKQVVQPKAIWQPKMAALAQPGQQEIRALTRLRSSSVVQRMEEPVTEIDSSDDESVDIRSCCNYPKIKGEDPWNDEESIIQHCVTYCGTSEKLTWVKFAYVVGAPPPELGHGSELEKKKVNKSKGSGGKKQGSAKDEKRWSQFQQSMESILALSYKHVKGNTNYQKAQKVVKEHSGGTPKWW